MGTGASDAVCQVTQLLCGELQWLQADLDTFADISSDYDIDGFFASAQSDVKLSVNFSRISEIDGITNVATVGVGDDTFAIWGEFPTTAVDTVQLIDYLSYSPNLDKDYDTVMNELSEFGFGGVEGFGLYDSDREPYFTVETDDFEAASQENVTIDLEG